MLIAMMVAFATFGLATGGYQAYRRRWLDAVRSVGGCSVAVAGYAALLLHKPVIGVYATLFGVVASTALIIASRRATRYVPADAQQS